MVNPEQIHSVAKGSPEAVHTAAPHGRDVVEVDGAPPLTNSSLTPLLSGENALSSLQFRGPILNLPAGARTETPVYALPDVPRNEFLNPETVAKHLATDRHELLLVARLASKQMGREIAPEEALRMITDRMAELMKKASAAVKEQDDSRVPILLTYLSRGVEVDPASWRFRLAEKFGMVKLATAEDYLAPKSSVSIMNTTHFKVGERVFAVKESSKRSQLSIEIGAVADELSHFRLNPHRQTKESIREMQDSLAGIARKLGISEDLLAPGSVTFENGRYHLGALGMIALARNGRDFIISYTNSAGEPEDVRLNFPQIQNAQRGVFPKWDRDNPPQDAQQRIYPTSPLKFWMDHLQTHSSQVIEGQTG